VVTQWSERRAACARASGRWKLLLQWRGNVAAVHRQLRDEGETVPCRQTLGRAFERALSLIERDFARRGDPALRDRAVYLRHEARFRGECYG
jgi:hypothetical protein